jgi:DNA-binding response OmpR family regulator
MNPLEAPSPRILVVERDLSMADLLVTTLQLEHYTPDVASSLEEAHDKVDQELYGLVLTDLFSLFPPRLEAIKPLRQRCLPTPIGIVSGWHIDQAEAERAGFAFVVEKPFDLDILLDHIRTHLAPTLNALQQEQQEHITAGLAALNARHWEKLGACLTPKVVYLSLTRNLFISARALFGQEALLTYVQQALPALPEFRIDHWIVIPHHGQAVIRFRSSWQGRRGQRQQLAGSLFFHFRGERISQIGLAMNTRRLQAMLEHG